jgi:hypothetical protein
MSKMACLLKRRFARNVTKLFQIAGQKGHNPAAHAMKPTYRKAVFSTRLDAIIR